MLISQLHVLAGVHAPAGPNSLIQLFSFFGELMGLRWAPLVLGGSVMIVAATVAKWEPRLPAPLLGVGLSALIAVVFRIHEPEVGSLHLSLPPFVGFAWTPQDMTTVLPAGFGLAFAVSVYLLLTSRAVEHYRGRHKAPRRTDADAELGAYGIEIGRAY